MSKAQQLSKHWVLRVRLSNAKATGDYRGRLSVVLSLAFRFGGQRSDRRNRVKRFSGRGIIGYAVGVAAGILVFWAEAFHLEAIGFLIFLIATVKGRRANAS